VVCPKKTRVILFEFVNLWDTGARACSFFFSFNFLLFSFYDCYLIPEMPAFLQNLNFFGMQESLNRSRQSLKPGDVEHVSKARQALSWLRQTFFAGIQKIFALI